MLPFRRLPPGTEPGLLIVQWDGVAEPVLRSAGFEELVGSHGGLGGWQTDAMLVHPASWPVTYDLNGPDAVHRQLADWLTMLGLRTPETARLSPIRES